MSLFDEHPDPPRQSTSDIETAEQRKERRDEHQAMWETKACPLCSAPMGAKCRRGYDKEVLAGLAHAARIQSVVSHWGDDNSLPDSDPVPRLRKAPKAVGELWADAS